MKRNFPAKLVPALAAAAIAWQFAAAPATAADKLVGIHSARVMSQSMPWIAQEAGLFKKYNLDFQLVFIASSNMVTAAMLSGDAEISLTGAVGNVRAFVLGATDLVFVAGVKNVMTQSILAGANLKKPEDLKGKQIGVSRIGSNTHYFTIQALRRSGMEPGRAKAPLENADGLIVDGLIRPYR